MRALVVGAGAVGGYFGGRLVEAGRDVTFLVRPDTAARMAENGLSLKSPKGDADLKARTVTAETLEGPYDVVLLSCKSYDLDQAIAAIQPAMGETSVVIPALNGIRHLDQLDAAFGRERVLGGLAQISARRSAPGQITHASDFAALAFGERDGTASERVAAIEAFTAGTKAQIRPSRNIMLEMWEKASFLAPLAAINCLMRADIGTIMQAAGGRDLVLALIAEVESIAEAAGYAPRPTAQQMARERLTDDGSRFKASMLSDLEGGGPTEGEHIFGDLVARADAAGLPVPLLRAALCNVMVYEAQRG